MAASRISAGIVPAVPRSRILPLAAAVTAVALGASPAVAAPVSPGKHDDARVVAFPLLAVKGLAPASDGSHVSHVSHSSHVSGTGGHVSHASHASHVSSVPNPGPATTAAQPPVAPITASPTSAVNTNTSGPPAVAPVQGSSLMGSSAGLGSGSPAASSGGGCAFVIVAPFGALVSWIRRLARRARAR